MRWSLAVLCCMAALSGCSSSYVLRGQAIEGGYSDVSFVSSGHATATAGAALGGVLINIYRDPDQMNRTLVASGRSAGDGSIDIEVGAFGTGWMDEIWLIEVYRDGYENVERTLRLPKASSGRELLITLRQGSGFRPEMNDELWEQYERYK